MATSVKQSEIKQSEIKQSEIKQSELKQSELKQSELKQSELKQTKAKTAKTSVKSEKSNSTEMVSHEDKALGQMYQKKTDKQHVLDNPDTYTGSMEMTEYDTYIYHEETKAIIAKQITIIPGLYKLFDEGVVNCRDHCVRMAQIISSGLTSATAGAGAGSVVPVSCIDISISADGTITMLNDGNGIDVAKHPEENTWIPEMIFAHLRTSTNYDKEQKKTTGGKNGFGVKLVFIWSSWGQIETVYHTR
jgi:DNA topoisomerase-2